MMCPVLDTVTLRRMDEKEQMSESRLLVAEQLELLEPKKGEIEAMVVGDSQADEALINDLVGIVLVVRAALLAGKPSGVNQGELEGAERTVRALLKAALHHQRAVSRR